MSIVITIIVALVVCAIYVGLHSGWVKTELAILHNRINAANSEVKMGMDDVRSTAANAKAIASNALSSAQRVESKVVKSIEGEVKNA